MAGRPGTRRMAARAAVTVVGGMLAASVVAPAVVAADAPVAWQAGAGVATRDQAVQANSFLPRQLSVNVGDSITWTVKSGEFHTVTFLSGAEAPPFVILTPEGPQINPAAAAPSGGPDYDGTGIANSGLLFTGQQFTLNFTKAGRYPFLCLIHAGMAGTVDVHDAGTAYPSSQRNLDVASLVTGNRLLATGRRLQAQTLASSHRSGTLAAGTGASTGVNGSLAIMRFLPSRTVIHAGQTVTWVNHDPETPHTVTFGEEPGGGPLGAFAPSGLDAPAHATIGAPGTSVNSGFTGSAFPFGPTFSVTFTAPGTYPFICALHDDLGMKGTIVVLP
jgi:plastocyanin